MQGTFSPHAAEAIATIFAGLMLIYFGARRGLALVDKDDSESRWWFIWRFVSAVGCIFMIIIGFSIVGAMMNDDGVIAVCRANGWNSVAALLIFSLLSAGAAGLNAFLPEREQVLN